MDYIKISNQWKPVSASYMKVGDSWVAISLASLPSYLANGAMIWGGYQSGSFIVHSLLIGGASNVEAESSQFQAIYDGQAVTGATWSIASGSSYASIDTSGNLTVNPSANKSPIVVACDYNTLSAIKAVEVTYKSGSSASTTTETTVDPDTGETTTTTTTVTENPDGTTTTSQTATTYDEEGNETGHVQTDTDVQGNVDTQTVVKDEDGNDVVTGYTIDTTNNPSGSKDITGTGVDTEFVPFDGSNGFELHIRFRSVKTEQPKPPIVVDTEDTGANYHFTILCSKSPFQPWPGFHIRWTLNKNNYSSGNIVFGYKAATGSSTNRNLAISKNNNIYDYTIAYDPKLKKYPSKFRCQDNLNGAATISLNVNFEELTYGVTLGYNINQQGQPYRYSNVEILEFSISKL